MPELGWHLMHRLVDDRVFILSPGDLRLAARIVLERGQRYGLLAFGFADNHLHSLLVCDRRQAGRFAQVVETSLHKRLRLEVPFSPFFPEPVRRQGHLYNTFRYCIRQDTIHQLHRDPFRDGTNLPSLLGLRVVGAWNTSVVRAHLPRIGRPELLELAAGFDALDTPPAEPRWGLLADAATAAAMVPRLDARSLDAAHARRAAVHLAADRVRPRTLAEHIGASRTSVWRLRQQTTDPALVSAVDLQLRLRSAAISPAL